MKALVLGAHLDDSIIAVGGIIRKIVDGGGSVDVVCFGNSDEDFSDVRDRESAPGRFLERAQEAHRILGARTFTCFNYSDYAVQESRETYRLCIESIRQYQPDVILSHYWAEYFQHRAMARLACDAWWQAGWTCSADLGPAWTAKALYHFEVIHPIPEPTDIVDVSSTFETKMKAWRCFAANSGTTSESREENNDAVYGSTAGGSLTDQMEARARYCGSLIGVHYAESLKRSFYLPRAIRTGEQFYVSL